MPRKSTTRGDVFRLTIANAVDSGIRLFVPIILVRILDQTEFGQYRLFWLIANTLALFVPLGMTRSLLYFLPRSTSAEKAAFVSQTVFYLAAISLPIAAVLGSGDVLLPDRVASLTEPAWLLGGFSFLWLLSSLILTLPNAEKDIRTQMYLIIALALIRAAMILGIAFATGNLQSIFAALFVFSIIQTACLGVYIARRFGMRLPWPKWSGMRRQLAYAVPFGVSGMLARARNQVEQWIVAFLFAPQALAIIAVAVSFNGIHSLLRHSVGGVLLPKMSSTHASGNILRSLELNNRGNTVVGFLMFPIVSFMWVFAPQLVEIMYTSDYLDAVPLVRLYCLTMILMSVELATVLMIYEQGPFVAKVSAGVLVLAAVLSYAGAIAFGLPGVVIGGVIGTLVTRLINYNRAAKLLGVSFSQLQDWRTLSKILIASLLSGAFAAYLMLPAVGQTSPLIQLLVAVSVFGPIYFAAVFLFRVHWVPLCMLGWRPWPEARNDASESQSE